MSKLYSDEDFPLPVVDELRRLGHDVLTAHAAGNANQQIPDEDVLAFAITQGRAALTRNRWHYIRLHKRLQPHCGIIVCSQDSDHVAQAQKINNSIQQCATLDSQLLRIHKS